jgi:RNase P subunit RPR2
MASRLRCPNCDSVLKEEGDASQTAEGEYRVYDNLANGKKKAGAYRLIMCLACGGTHRPQVYLMAEINHAVDL